MRSGITVAIPTIPPRRKLLARALDSVAGQVCPASDIVIAYDLNREGAGPTRSRALDSVRTEWTAFLDDDDEFYPQHLNVLIHFAEATGADLVYPWFDVAGGNDPFPVLEHLEFDPEHPHMFPITVLARTEILQDTGGFRREPSLYDASVMEGEDWIMWLNVLKAGGVIKHAPERTWKWHHDSGNTSGMPTW